MLVKGDYRFTCPLPDRDYDGADLVVHLHCHLDGRRPLGVVPVAKSRLRREVLGAGQLDRHEDDEVDVATPALPGIRVSPFTDAHPVPTDAIADRVASYGRSVQRRRLSTDVHRNPQPVWGVMARLVWVDGWLIVEADGDVLTVGVLAKHALEQAPTLEILVGVGGSDQEEGYHFQAGRVRAPRATRPGWRWLQSSGALRYLPRADRERVGAVLDGLGLALARRPRPGRAQAAWKVRTSGTPNPIALLAAFSTADLQRIVRGTA